MTLHSSARWTVDEIRSDSYRGYIEKNFIPPADVAWALVSFWVSAYYPAAVLLQPDGRQVGSHRVVFQSRFLLALLFQGFVLLLLLLVLIKSGEAVLPDYVAIFLLEVSSELGSSESTRMPCLLRAIISKARDAEIVTRFAGMLRSVEYVILCASISGLK